MATFRRRARCASGQLSITTEGEPVKISACHCRECQRRTGSAFGWQSSSNVKRRQFPEPLAAA
ncbi:MULTISPECIES: GFA family protein [unclassified Rhizobium]